MQDLNLNWSGQQTETLLPTIDEQRVAQTERALSQAALDHQLTNVASDSPVFKQAAGLRLYYSGKLLTNLSTVLGSHPGSYADAKQDAADLATMAQGRGGVERLANQGQAFTDKASADMALREAVLGQRCMNIVQGIINLYKAQVAAGKIDPELALVYNSVLPIYEQMMARSQDGKRAADALRAEGGSEASYWKDLYLSQEQLNNAAQAKIAELQGQLAAQPTPITSPGVTPTTKAVANKKSARKTPRG